MGEVTNHSIRKHCKEVYAKDGQSGVKEYCLKLDEKLNNIDWLYCPGCASEGPAIKGTTECLVCGQPCMDAVIKDSGYSVRFVRQNEVEDIFFVWGNGIREYVKHPRSSHMTETDVLNNFI